MTKQKRSGAPAQPKKPTPIKLAFDPVEAALRELFDGMAAEAVPDDFDQLIARLGEDDAAAGKQPQ